MQLELHSCHQPLFPGHTQHGNGVVGLPIQREMKVCRIADHARAVVLAALTVGAPQAGFLHGQTRPDASEPQPTAPAAEYLDSANGRSAEASVSMPPARPVSGPFLHRVVPPGLGPQPLTSDQKFEMSIRSRASFGALGSSIFGAGERQLFNSRPHYGTDSGAFGERLGAAELKQVTESFFSYGLYASAFHEDPHYYVMGRGHSIVHRAVYSATRVVLTRTDAGGTGINWAKLAGMGSATALTNAYYPPQDRGVGETFSAYGASLASSMLTLELHEFVPDLKRAILHRHRSTE